MTDTKIDFKNRSDCSRSHDLTGSLLDHLYRRRHEAICRRYHLMNKWGHPGARRLRRWKAHDNAVMKWTRKIVKIEAANIEHTDGSTV